MTARTVLAGAVAVLALTPVVLACYCDEKPFRQVAPRAEFVVVGVAEATSEWKAKPGDECALGTAGWQRRIKITHVIKGKRPDGEFLVGGGASSCDLYPDVLTTGKTYAFAFSAAEKVPGAAFYWLRMCTESSVLVQDHGAKDGATLPQIRAWAVGREL